MTGSCKNICARSCLAAVFLFLAAAEAPPQAAEPENREDIVWGTEPREAPEQNQNQGQEQNTQIQGWPIIIAPEVRPEYRPDYRPDYRRDDDRRDRDRRPDRHDDDRRDRDRDQDHRR